MEKKQSEKRKTPRQSRLLRQAALVLEDGSEYPGWSFGKAKSQAGEVVFNTGMSGFQRLLTDPAARGQILVASFPLAGNCGAPVMKNGEPFFDEYGLPLHLESEGVQAAGFVVSEICDEPGHYSGNCSFSAWLEKENVPGIYGIDTRALVTRLRDRGAMRGKILVEGARDVTFDSGTPTQSAADISHKEIKTFIPGERGDAGKRVRIALIDCGVKAGTIRGLLSYNAEVIRLPWNHDLGGIEYDGLFLSGGPGDPKSLGKTVAAVRKAFTLGRPVFGEGLGNQIMALAAGADTYRLPCGHRGQNQPCLESGGKRCYITAQNHGYAVRGETLPRGWEIWFTNANDGTVEGIRSVKNPFSAVQFHPEGCPGPADTEFLFGRFIEQIKERM